MYILYVLYVKECMFSVYYRADGTALAGHVVGDLVVFTTAEVVLGECGGAEFSRQMDQRTGFEELVVEPRDQ